MGPNKPGKGATGQASKPVYKKKGIGLMLSVLPVVLHQAVQSSPPNSASPQGYILKKSKEALLRLCVTG